MFHFIQRKLASLRSAGVGAALMALLVFAPTPAAAFCPPCLMDSVISLADVAAKAATLAQMAASQASTLAGIAESTLKTTTGQQGSTASVVGGREKELAAEKELVQAELNYSAASDSQKRFAEAQDKFTAPSAQAYRVCETVVAAASARTVGDESRSMAKAMNYASSQRQTFVENAAQRGKEVLDNYRANYCSSDDEARGRCTAVADKRMQNAAVSADTLMTPVAGETLNEQEKIAAADYIEMVTNPVPPELLPKGMDNKSPAAERFNIAQMNSQAQMSMATTSLQQIMASKSATGTSAEKSISVVGLMKQFVEDKFGNSEYAKGVGAMDNPGLLKEINIQMAARNWINYQSYLQNERMEAVLATQLAIAVKDNSEREIAVARAQVGSR